MCGRFFVEPDDMSDAELLALLYREKEKADSVREEKRLSFGEIRPGDQAVVIANNRKLERSAFVMQWGYHINKHLLINARSETVAEKSAFCQSMINRRCLIPANAYFEWDHRVMPMQKYRFFSPETRIIYLAGLYRFEDEHKHPVFTILTREASPDIACFHDRMPVIMPSALKDAWLDCQYNASDLIRESITSVAWSIAQ